jgi:hypothetical protein
MTDIGQIYHRDRTGIPEKRLSMDAQPFILGTLYKRAADLDSSFVRMTI